MENRVCFSKVAGIARSDESFELRAHVSHHSVNFKDKKSVVELAGFGMVSQFPLDPMHLVDLGVVKNRLNCRLREEISEFYTCRVWKNLQNN